MNARNEYICSLNNGSINSKCPPFNYSCFFVCVHLTGHHLLSPLFACFAYAEFLKKNLSKWISYFIASNSVVRLSLHSYSRYLNNRVQRRLICARARAIAHELEFFIFQLKFASHAFWRSLAVFCRRLIFTLATETNRLPWYRTLGANVIVLNFVARARLCCGLGFGQYYCKFNNAIIRPCSVVYIFTAPRFFCGSSHFFPCWEWAICYACNKKAGSRIDRRTP